MFQRLGNYLVAIHHNGMNLSRLVMASRPSPTPEAFYEASRSSIDSTTLRLIRAVDMVRQLPGLILYPVTMPLSAFLLGGMLLVEPEEFDYSDE